MGALISLRPMGLADVDAVLRLQLQCYGPGLIEGRSAFESKLIAVEAVGCCWMAWRENEPLAYAVSLPVSADSFPVLNAKVFELSTQPQLLYLHDLAVAPAGRELGLARRMLGCVLQSAADQHLREVGLIAVQDSLAFWERQGFAEQHALPPLLRAKVASFGAAARYLRRDI